MMPKLDTDAPAMGSLYRHKKRGSSYLVLGVAKLQTARALKDDDVLVVYQSADGEIWTRPLEEFQDGRFELISSNNERS